jgi:hypothetical protein
MLFIKLLKSLTFPKIMKTTLFNYKSESSSTMITLLLSMDLIILIKQTGEKMRYVTITLVGLLLIMLY